MQLKKNFIVKPSKRVLISSIILGIMMVVALLLGLKFINHVYGQNIKTKNSAGAIIFIPNNASIEEVTELISREKLFVNEESFRWVAKMKGNKRTIKGGRYKLNDGMSNNELINILLGGIQTPVQVTFNNIRTKEALASAVSKRLDLDSAELVNLLNDATFLEKYQLNPYTALTIFIPNTYEVYWNTDASSFIKRMHHEYNQFWTDDRKAKAQTIKLSLDEVSTLASIVDEETIKNDEKPMVAGLYLNRLKKGIPLQADPTVKFANGNFAANRVLNVDKLIDSPYNTYKYAGLPPGPIRVPSISGIESVLNAVDHKYYYMCAKEDFSGYHNFAKTLDQHNVNAAKYRRELNKRRIYR